MSDLLQMLRAKVGNRCVAIVMVRVDIWHWTVIARITEQSLVLSDSDGLGAIRIENCSVVKSDKRYRIHARELLLLETVATTSLPPLDSSSK